jgi:glycosyltransferase involved in cell wall biosynthesis
MSTASHCASIEETGRALTHAGANAGTIVLLVHTWFPNHQSLVELIAEESSHPVSYFVLSQADGNRAWGDFGEVRVPPRVVPGFRMRLGPYQVNLNMGVAKSLAGIRPAVIITKGWGDPGYFAAHRMASERGVPLITWMCGRDPQTPGSLGGRFLRAVSTAFARRVIRQSRFVFAYGSRARKDALTLGAKEEAVVVVKHSIDEGHFAGATNSLSHDARSALRRRLGLDDTPLFLCISQLIPRKGIRDLLDAFGCLRKKKVDCQLLLIGDGELRPLVQQFLQTHLDRVAWVPSIPYADIPHYYALADCLVLATHFDAWATVINEAHCAELPVISSDGAHAVDDLIVHGQTGLVYPAGNVPALVEALKYAADHLDCMKRMAEDGCQLVHSTWSLRESARIWTEHIQIAIEERCR